MSWRPFLDPIDAFHDLWWTLLVPLSFGIAVIYKAVRLRSMEHYWRRVIIFTLEIVTAMILLGAAIYLFIHFYVRFIADQAA